MARETHEREDLLRDARALVPRAVLRLPQSHAVQVFFGFRGQSLSVYFGEEPVFHFNDRGELRRAFVGERLIKAERGQLVALVRDRSVDQSNLLRQLMSAAEHVELLADLQLRIQDLLASIRAGACTLVGFEPAGSQPVERLAEWLVAHPAPTVAASPRVG